MTHEDRTKPDSPIDKKAADKAEETRKLVRELAETPPVKPMADVKAASEVYEANADEPDAQGAPEPTRKTSP